MLARPGSRSGVGTAPSAADVAQGCELELSLGCAMWLRNNRLDSGMELGTSTPAAPLWLLPGAPCMLIYQVSAPRVLQGRVLKGLGRLRLRLVMILVGFG